MNSMKSDQKFTWHLRQQKFIIFPTCKLYCFILDYNMYFFFFNYNKDYFSFVFNLLKLFFKLQTCIFLVAECFIFNNHFVKFFLLVKDVIALLSNGLLRYIFMFNTDQCFFIFFETFGDALLKRKVNAILFSIFLFFLVLRGSPLLETFPFYICLIRCVTLSNKFLQRILGMVFKDTLKACFWLFI